MLLKEKTGCPLAASIGAAAAVLPVLAFRPGGWLREGGGTAGLPGVPLRDGSGGGRRLNRGRGGCYD
jgi:hypothetical protein